MIIDHKRLLTTDANHNHLYQLPSSSLTAAAAAAVAITTVQSANNTRQYCTTST